MHVKGFKKNEFEKTHLSKSIPNAEFKQKPKKSTVVLPVLLLDFLSRN